MSLTPTRQPIVPKIKHETIKKLLKQGERIDGRKLDEYRPIEVFLNPIPKAEGSAAVKLGNTFVITGVKLEIGTPYSDRPNEGVLQVHAEFVPLASPTFEPGPPDENAIETARVIDRSLREPRAIRLEDLVVIPGKKVWLIFNDLYLIDHYGNIVDTGMLSTMLALNMTKIPRIVSIEDENVVIDKTVKEAPLPLNLNVVTVTLGIIDDVIIVDPNIEEELVVDSRITFAVDETNRIVGIQKMGMKGIKPKMIDQLVDIALKKASELHSLLREVLNNPDTYIKTLV
ncbi:ribosomal RNA-processing protein RRP42 [Staphylothermus marinus F1]|uniref:Exosome complex component Rrp42 n=1 Tax=Staphylothermus marinus (strain ATCC 43588 / DSM 3639 / JCM 9404 / F1) TaxID=399550 RepID=A3DMV0_STAMF|nr:exosome complex protein Rrp42 [Staphylothermus marinus]ABN69960.1 ribosomal RNA-processing protein RRP42 [Staphylothermus marinus F1]